MQLNKLRKSLLIAIPVMTLAACSSSTKVEEHTSSVVDNTPAPDETVPVETVVKEKTPEEILAEKYEALRQEEQVVYFDFDKSTVRSDYVELLQAHADFLVKIDMVLSVSIGLCKSQSSPLTRETKASEAILGEISLAILAEVIGFSYVFLSLLGKVIVTIILSA